MVDLLVRVVIVKVAYLAIVPRKCLSLTVTFRIDTSLTCRLKCSAPFVPIKKVGDNRNKTLKNFGRISVRTHELHSPHLTSYKELLSPHIDLAGYHDLLKAFLVPAHNIICTCTAFQMTGVEVCLVSESNNGNSVKCDIRKICDHRQVHSDK